MKKRFKVLTAILLSAAMTLGSLSAGFAEEATEATQTESTMEAQSEEPTGEAAAASSEEGDKDKEPAADASDENITDTSAESADDEGTADNNDNGEEGIDEDAEGESETPEATEELPKTDEASGNGIEADADADGEVSGNVADVQAELDDESSSGVKTYTTREYSHEYDGSAYTPGNYTIPKGGVLLTTSEYTTDTAKKVGGKTDAAQTITLPSIKTVSQSYAYYLYPANATTTTSFTEKISVKVTARPVTYRSGSYTKEYDGKPLSQNSAVGATNPTVVKGSLVKGENFAFKFDPKAQITEVGSVKNVFTISSNGTADTRNYDASYEYGNLIVSASRNNVNQLATPTKAKATIDNKGKIKLTWKKVKSYKESGKKGGKTSYKIFRYNENGTWTQLTEGVTKAKFMDINASEGERYIYKILSYGYDAYGQLGECELPAYVRATPKITNVSPYDGIKYASITFMGLGTDTDNYTLQHWNNKNKSNKEEVTVNKYNSTSTKYTGTARTISTNTYLDGGSSNVTISVNKATLSFRIKSDETTVYDYGKSVTIEGSAWSKTQKLKMISTAPVLKGERKSNSSFKLKWNKINKATGYLLEYSTDKNFSTINDVTKTVYSSKSEKSSTYNSREYTVEDVGVGVPYYCRVTAFYKKKGDGSQYGTALGTSAVIVQYGRQAAVKDLEAEYYEDGNPKADAKLTWTDDVENVRGYYIQRWSYAYNSSTKMYDKETGHVVLQGYTSENATRKKYANTVGDKLNDGELIKYRVQSVIYYGGTAGENYDGYVFSEPAEYFYMNPTEASFAKKKYTVKVGGTLTPALKFKPKKLPKKTDEYTQSEFSKIFCFNDTMEYVLQSDDLTASEIKKYVTVGTSTGKLTGVKKYTKTYIKLKASSPNDPSNVYATTTVCVAANGDDTGSDKTTDTSSLVVCIDPGHGGKDDGATGNSLVEKDLNLTIAKKVGKYLEDKGAKVYYTRTTDKYVSLTDRTDYADEKGCNLFVSIHCNSSESSSSRGTEVYYSVKSKYAKASLAGKISSAVASALGTKNIGAKTRQGSDGDYYSVIRTSAAKGIPGLIVEHAFISNSDDAKLLKDDSLLDDAAKAEANAIYKYWND